MSTRQQFEPTIVAFCCTFCAGIAGAGVRSKKPGHSSSVRVIKLPCVGKIDAIHVLKAFAAGADGVFVAGGPFGQCRFMEGMSAAQKKIEYTKKLLKELGIEPERLESFALSQAEGQQFIKAAEVMVKRARALGPSPLKKSKKAA
jgi:coenzyme F420-reducing hydrogenase delta subunit